MFTGQIVRVRIEKKKEYQKPYTCISEAFFNQIINDISKYDIRDLETRKGVVLSQALSAITQSDVLARLFYF